MRGLFILSLLALALVCLGPRATPAPAGSLAGDPRARMLLDGEWEIRVPGYDAWVGRVPEAGDLNRQRDAATYRTSVKVPADWRGRGRVVLRFDRVLFGARVVWNGAAVGEHFGNRTGFDVDVSGATRFGQDNALQVEASSAADHDPQSLRFYVTDLQHMRDAAIAGDVWLELRPTLEASWDRIVTSVRDRTLAVTTRVENHEERGRRVRLAATVHLDGQTKLTLPTRDLDVPPNGSAESTVKVDWPDARPWGPPGYGTATLYTLRTEVLGEDGRPADRRLTRFGFREIAVEGTQLLLNGQPLFIAGLRTTGHALERHALAFDLAAWQQMGFNAVESHEEARLPDYYDLADEMGMLVISGNFCGGMVGSLPSPGAPGALPSEAVQALDASLYAWVTEERNHPSIVLWNPCGADPQMREVVCGAVARADDTRPLPYRDYMPQPGFLDGRAPGGDAPPARGAWFIFETMGNAPAEAGWVSVMAPFLKVARDSGAFGVVINALPTAGGGSGTLPWPSTSGPDPRPPSYGVRSAYGAEVATAMREALRAPAPEVRTLSPEVLVRVGRPGVLVALAPVDGAQMETTIQATDRDGRAWFMVPEAGRYRAWLVDTPTVRAERGLSRHGLGALGTLETYDVIDLHEAR